MKFSFLLLRSSRWLVFYISMLQWLDIRFILQNAAEPDHMQFGIILTWVSCSFAFSEFSAEVSVGFTLLEFLSVKYFKK